MIQKKDIKPLKELLNMELKIPEYQRPYKWNLKNYIGNASNFV